MSLAPSSSCQSGFTVFTARPSLVGAGVAGWLGSVRPSRLGCQVLAVALGPGVNCAPGSVTSLPPPSMRAISTISTMITTALAPMPIHFTMGERPAFSSGSSPPVGLRRWIKYPVPLSIKKIYLRSPFSSGWALCFILLRPAWKRSSLPGAGETEPSGLRTAMSRGKNSRTRTTTPRRVSIAAYTMPLASCPTARPTRMRPASIVPGESWLMGTAADASPPQCGQICVSLGSKQ